MIWSRHYKILIYSIIVWADCDIIQKCIDSCFMEIVNFRIYSLTLGRMLPILIPFFSFLFGSSWHKYGLWLSKTFVHEKNVYKRSLLYGLNNTSEYHLMVLLLILFLFFSWVSHSFLLLCFIRNFLWSAYAFRVILRVSSSTFYNLVKITQVFKNSRVKK